MSKRYALLGQVVLGEQVIKNGAVVVDGSTIANVGARTEIELPETVIDYGDRLIMAGFIDIHCHAGGGKRFEHDPATAAQAHLPYGTTSMLATLAYRQRTPEYVESIATIRKTMATPEGINIAGIYMEGPYINPDFGSLSHLNPWRKPVLPEDYEPIIAAGADLIRVWTVAPEREDIEPFMKAAKAANPHVKFTVGHAQASPQQIERLIPYGLCIGTHHTNATGDLPKYPECRGVCVDECVNYNDGIYAEVISDSMGIHVDPYMQRLIRKIKGDDKIILITDQTAHQGENPPGLEHVTDLNFTPIEGGGIDVSGSRLTLNVACRNWMKHTGASIVDAFKAGSYNPAKAVGLTDRGEIREGLRADLIFVDIKMNVSKIILNGEIVKG